MRTQEKNALESFIFFFSVSVRLGEHDQTTDRDCHPELGCAPPAMDFEVERVISHPQYVKDDLRNDIALVRLKGSVKFSQGWFSFFF